VRDPGFRVFLSDNITSLGPNVARGPSADVIEPARVVPGSGLPVLPAAVVRERVLARAGARWPTPDPVDARILAEAAAGRGKLINTPSEAGDPPARPSGAPLAPDRDGDGIPDDAERAIGSNPDIADSHMITPGSPYAFIEIYAESLRAPR